jgi:hypothetical protein
MILLLLKRLWTLSPSEIVSSLKRKFYKKGGQYYSLEILNRNSLHDSWRDALDTDLTSRVVCLLERNLTSQNLD